jgi:hypothetical protein
MKSATACDNCKDVNQHNTRGHETMACSVSTHPSRHGRHNDCAVSVLK